MNTVRLWLSYDAFRYEEERQAQNFEKALAICEKYGCKVVPVLFNCWHDAVMDNGGIYHSQMIAGSIWSATETMYDSFIDKIVKPHADDARILLWDICNEPYSYGENLEFRKLMQPYETEWLRKMAEKCKEAGTAQPLGISTAGVFDIKYVADFVDVYLIHPYYFYKDSDLADKTAALSRRTTARESAISSTH